MRNLHEIETPRIKLTMFYHDDSQHNILLNDTRNARDFLCRCVEDNACHKSMLRFGGQSEYVHSVQTVPNRVKCRSVKPPKWFKVPLYWQIIGKVSANKLGLVQNLTKI